MSPRKRRIQASEQHDTHAIRYYCTIRLGGSRASFAESWHIVSKGVFPSTTISCLYCITGDRRMALMYLFHRLSMKMTWRKRYQWPHSDTHALLSTRLPE